jgi:cytochrome c553
VSIKYKRSLLVGLGLLICTTSAAEDIDTMAQRMLPCAACHGEEGRASREGYFPRIAGKPEGYLYHQLLHFRDGLRRHDGMRYLIERQSDEYLREMAAYFAALELPYPPPLAQDIPPERLARGEALVSHGDEAIGVPACQACHGERLTGIAPDLPGIIGLPPDYIAAQFGNWRESSRRTVPPDCMSLIAHRLSLADITAVSAWLAAHPMPTDTRPDAELGQPLPMPCGSVRSTGVTP